MAVTIRTIAEVKDSGLDLYLPDWLAGQDDDYVLGHDDDDGALRVWGPAWDRPEAERLAKAFD